MVVEAMKMEHTLSAPADGSVDSFHFGAGDNVASEDVVYLLNGLGIACDVDLDSIAAVGDWITRRISRPNRSKSGVALSSLD